MKEEIEELLKLSTKLADSLYHKQHSYYYNSLNNIKFNILERRFKEKYNIILHITSEEIHEDSSATCYHVYGRVNIIEGNEYMSIEIYDEYFGDEDELITVLCEMIAAKNKIREELNGKNINIK